MQKNKLIFSLLWTLLWPLGMRAQLVDDVVAEQVGSTIHVYYTLHSKSTVSLVAVFGDGSELECSDVSGDVGQDVKPGRCEIVWNVLSDMQELRDDNLRFRVQTSPSTTKLRSMRRQTSLYSYYLNLEPLFGYEFNGGLAGFGSAISWNYGSSLYVLGSYAEASLTFPSKLTTDSVSCFNLMVGPTLMLTSRWMISAGIGVDIMMNKNEEGQLALGKITQNLKFAYGFGTSVRVSDKSILSLRVHLRPNLPRLVRSRDDDGRVLETGAAFPTYIAIGYGICFN